MFLTLIALWMILTMLMMMEDPHLNACVDQTAVVGLQLDVNLRRQISKNGSKGDPNYLEYVLHYMMNVRGLSLLFCCCQTSGSRNVCKKEGPGGASGSGAAVNPETSIFDNIPGEYKTFDTISESLSYFN